MAAYFDHNATTPVDRAVVEAMLPFLQEHFGNPSSVYRRGRLARQAVESAREQVAQLVNVSPAQVIFTSGGTEANNLAIRGVGTDATCVAVSAIEHPSVLEPARRLAAAGCDVHYIGVDHDGRVDEVSLSNALSCRPQLVSIMTANNETGVIQNIQGVAAQIAENGAVFHSDAVQAAGKMPLDFNEMGVQMLTLSAHKINGPKGVGALIIDNQVELLPQLLGGGHEGGLRSGTENVAGIVGFGKAAELVKGSLSSRRSRLLELKQFLESQLANVPGAVVFAEGAERLPNTVYMAIPGIDGETLLMELDRDGIEVSSGSACDSQKMGPSHVLTAMGVDEALARCAIRISLGQDNTTAEVQALVAALKRQADMLSESSVLAWV